MVSGCYQACKSTPLTGPNTPEGVAAKRQEILDYFHRTYSCYEKLFEVITSNDAYYIRPDPLRHPLIFYYGHTAVLYINKLLVAKALPARVNEKYESMLATGVDEVYRGCRVRLVYIFCSGQVHLFVLGVLGVHGSDVVGRP